MTGWLIIPASLLVAVVAGQIGHLRDRHRAAGEVELERITAALPAEREDLTGVDMVPVGGRWSQRQTPLLTDLADNDGPAQYRPERNRMQGCEPPTWYVPVLDRVVDVPVISSHVHHASDGVADGLLTYPGRHRLDGRDVTAEFHQIVLPLRTVVYEEVAA